VVIRRAVPRAHGLDVARANLWSKSQRALRLCEYKSDVKVPVRAFEPGIGRRVSQSLSKVQVYEGGKYDKRNQKYAELIEIAFPSIKELRELFLRAGYTEVQMFEKYDRGWICGIGRKPL
jgi:adenylate cyclase class IV